MFYLLFLILLIYPSISQALFLRKEDPHILPPDNTQVVDTSFGSNLLVDNSKKVTTTKNIIYNSDEASTSTLQDLRSPSGPGNVADNVSGSESTSSPKSEELLDTASSSSSSQDVVSNPIDESVTPPAHAPVGDDTCVAINIQSQDTQIQNGRIKIKLNEDAPETVANFLKYIDSKYYEKTIFHRVIENFMIQTGGFTKDLYTSGDSTTEKSGQFNPIINEATLDKKNLVNTVSMARTSNPDSATSQFFINVKDNESLDGNHDDGYSVFGIVIEGKEIVEEISKTKTKTIGESFENCPENLIEIISAERVEC